jgi:hypothetical protein
MWHMGMTERSDRMSGAVVATDPEPFEAIVGMRGSDVVRRGGNAWEVHRMIQLGQGYRDLRTSDRSYDMVTFGDTAVVTGGGFEVGSAPPFAIRVGCQDERGAAR